MTGRQADLTDLRTLVAILLLTCAGRAECADRIGSPADQSPASVEQPNIVVIMADDLGYADLGCYGGEIDTPNIDRLAREGLQFSHFRATPMCVTSRVALLAGMPFHRAGKQTYKHATPLPIALKAAGYRTMMVGKWHAGTPDPRSSELFDRSFGFLGGATDSFVGGNDWFADRESFRNFGDDFYATSAFAERSVAFIQEATERGEPFFMYVAFNAPHHPCQAPQGTVAKYAQTYHAGYETIRNERRARQIQLGLVDRSWAVAPTDASVRQWNELPAQRREIEASRMAAYAAAVDEVDQAVGTIVSAVDRLELAKNTIVLFLSDNGGDYSNGSPESDVKQIAWKPRSNPSSSNGWASAKCTPFRHFKHACHEGGLAVPFVVRWPQGIAARKNTLIRDAVNITDIYPTLLDIAGAASDNSQNESQRSLTGTSLLPLFRGETLTERPPLFSWYQFSASWTDGDWKTVRLYDGPWALFDLANDRGETTDLASMHPARTTQMISDWQAFAHASEVENVSKRAITPQRGWGWHRLKMVCPQLVSLAPANGATNVPSGVKLELTFAAPISFDKSDGRQISLWSASDESGPLWVASPGSDHAAVGTTSIIFNNLPALAPETNYAIRWDPGWIRVGGKPVGPLNDGAYWWRFRTAK